MLMRHHIFADRLGDFSRTTCARTDGRGVLSIPAITSAVCNWSSCGRIVTTRLIGAWAGAVPERRQSANNAYCTTLFASIWARKKLSTDAGSRPIAAPSFTALAMTFPRGAHPRPVLLDPISPALLPWRWLACEPMSPPVPEAGLGRSVKAPLQWPGSPKQG